MHTFIEVCAGCGGLSTGFIEAGFSPILLNEINKDCCETLKKNHGGALVVKSSMTDLDLSEHRPDVLMGGVPCQPFSHAGKRKGLEDPRGRLMIEFNEFIKKCKPKAFLVENVRGLATHNKGKTLSSIIDLFLNDGAYKIKYKILNAGNYEVPQKRERLIIVGIRCELNAEYEFPEPSPTRLTLRNVLENVPPSEGISYSEQKKEVLKLVPEGKCWTSLPDDVKEKYMGGAFKSGGGKTGFARRTKLDDQCPTLLTSPSQKQTDRCHPTETRPFTVREYARIQTFSDDYHFCGSVASKYKQIGNAVPPALARKLALSIKKTLENAIDSGRE